MLRSKILGVGTFLPPRRVTNQDLQSFMDTTDEWIQQRTGIRERRWVDPGETNSGMAVKAAERALESAGLKKSDVDMIIYGTLSPDHEFPGSACYFQAKLGVPGIPALDIRQQCTGFLIRNGDCGSIYPNRDLQEYFSDRF